MGGFPLSSGEELSLKLFQPGVQGAARVLPSPAGVSLPLGDTSGWEGKTLQGGTEEQICLETDLTRLGLSLLSPQPTSPFQELCACCGWLPQEAQQKCGMFW